MLATLAAAITVAVGASGQCPAPGSCCESHGTPGCGDAACCSLICGQDEFCCTSQWDQICADAACAQCSGCDCFPDCTLPCEAGDLSEPEPCGADQNGGCNDTPPDFDGVGDGETVCGSAWSGGGMRDTDWYLLHTAFAATRITAAIASEFSSVCYVIEGVGVCAPVVIGVPGDSAGCVSGTPASAVVPGGDYVVFVATSTFNGVPCGSGNAYRLAVTAICDGDTNGDLIVNVVDVVAVVLTWNTPGIAGNFDADVNDDGITNVEDLVIVLKRWGPCLM